MVERLVDGGVVRADAERRQVAAGVTRLLDVTRSIGYRFREHAVRSVELVSAFFDIIDR